jgi:hypothetical protein
LGRVGEASAELDLAAQLVDGRHPYLRTQLAWSRAGSLLHGGHWREADELSRTTCQRHARTEPGAAQFNRVVQRWEAEFLTGGSGGGIGGGTDLVDELRAVMEGPGPPPLHGILAMALTEAGRVHDARAALDRLPRWPRDHLWLYACCWALLAASRLGETELATQLRGHLLPYRQLTCSVTDVAISGPVAYFTAEAALVLGDPDAALADLAIATGRAQRMGAKPWLAHVRGAIKRARQLRGTRHGSGTHRVKHHARTGVPPGA